MRNKSIAIALVAVLLTACAPAFAVILPADLVWTGTAGSAWDNGLTANFDDGGTPSTFADGDSVTFDDSASSFTVDIAVGDVFPAGVIVNNMTHDYTIGGSNGILGAAGILKNGDGVLTLDSTANGYSGFTWVQGGTLRLGNHNVLPDTTMVRLDNGTTFDRNGHNDAVARLMMDGATVQGSGTLTLGSPLISTGVDTIRDGDLTLSTDLNASVAVSLDMQDDISGAFGITKSDAGNLYLRGNSSYTGVTTVEEGTLTIGNNNALGTTAGNTVVEAGATLAISGGVFYTTAEPVTLEGDGDGGVGALYAPSAISRFDGPITLASNTAIGVDITAVLTLNGAVTGPHDLEKIGLGTLELGSSSNAWGGATHVSRGSLQLGAADVIPDASLVRLEQDTWLTRTGHNETIGNLSMDGATIHGLGTLTLGGNVSTTGNNVIQDGPVSLSAGRDVTVSGGYLQIMSPVHGAGGIVKTGDGDLYLTAGGSYAGDTDIQQGRVLISGDSALGAATGGTTVRDNAALFLTGAVAYATLEPLTLNGDGDGDGALYAQGGDSNFDGPIALATDTEVGVEINRVLTLNGPVTGGGKLTKTGLGTLVLANSANNYNGTHVERGTLRLGASNVLPDPDLVRLDASTWLDRNGFNEGIAQLQMDGATIQGLGTLTIDGIVNTTGNNVIQGGPVSLSALRDFTIDGGYLQIMSTLEGPGDFNKHGSGQMLLGANNTYAGQATVNAGRLVVPGNEALGGAGSGRTIVNAGATLELRGNVPYTTPEALTLHGQGETGWGALLAIGGASTFAGPITIPTDATVQVFGGASLQLDGRISGNGELEKIGGGVLILTNPANNWTGGTRVISALRLGASDVIPDDQVALRNATFDRNGFDETVGALAMDGSTVQGLGTLTLGGTLTCDDDSGSNSMIQDGPLDLGGDREFQINGGILIVQSPVQGAGAGLLKTGGSPLHLSHPANDYSGATIVRDGTLVIGPAGALTATSSVLVEPNGTLHVDGTVNSLVTVQGTLSGSGVIGAFNLEPGGTLSPGDSPGITSAGDTTWTGAGNYNWQIHNALGLAGAGYDLLDVTGFLDVTAAAGFSINLWSLLATGPDVYGDAINFSAAGSYDWTLATATGGVLGFDPASFIIQTGANNGTTGFSNATGAGVFSLTVEGGTDLVLHFGDGSEPQPAIPEPATLTLLGAALLAVRRRRSR